MEDEVSSSSDEELPKERKQEDRRVTFTEQGRTSSATKFEVSVPIPTERRHTISSPRPESPKETIDSPRPRMGSEVRDPLNRRGTFQRSRSIAAWKVWQNKLVEQKPLGSVRARKNAVHPQILGNEVFKPPEESVTPDDIQDSSDEKDSSSVEEEAIPDNRAVPETKPVSKAHKLRKGIIS